MPKEPTPHPNHDAAWMKWRDWTYDEKWAWARTRKWDTYFADRDAARVTEK